MPVTQKLGCVVERVVAHGERVYTLALRPERLVPRFRAGQFLHLALDPYDPSGFWPESRVFSIASPPAQRDAVRITYAVHGRFTARMESDLVEGRQVWIKMPYGDFVVDSRADVMLFAGGTGITAFTAFLEGLAAPGATPSAFERRCIPPPPQRGCRVGDPGPGGVAPPSNTPGILGRHALPDGRIAALGATMDLHHGLLTPAGDQSVTLAYGARTDRLLIYRDVVERCAQRLPSLDVSYFVEHGRESDPPALEGRVRSNPGRVSVAAVWPRLRRPLETTYYISGPPPMLRTIGQDLRARNISPEAIHIDAWE